MAWADWRSLEVFHLFLFKALSISEIAGFPALTAARRCTTVVGLVGITHAAAAAAAAAALHGLGGAAPDERIIIAIVIMSSSHVARRAAAFKGGTVLCLRILVCALGHESRLTRPALHTVSGLVMFVAHGHGAGCGGCGRACIIVAAALVVLVAATLAAAVAAAAAVVVFLTELELGPSFVRVACIGCGGCELDLPKRVPGLGFVA